jgi:hypothetical protein
MPTADHSLLINWYPVGVMLPSHLGEGQVATLAASQDEYVGIAYGDRTRLDRLKAY